MTAIINVKKSGSDNRARVLKWSIMASSTNSPEIAVTAAAEKLCARLNRAHEQIALKRVTSTQLSEIWLLTLPEVKP